MIRRALAGLAGFLTGEDGDDDGDHHIDFDTDPFLFALYISISVVLVCMAGLMSGLTLGLMSMDSVELEVLRRTGTSEEKRYAAIIMPASCRLRPPSMLATFIPYLAIPLAIPLAL